MTITDDPIFDWERHCTEEQEAIDSAPVCDCCGELIVENYFYAIDGEIFCDECITEIVNEKFKQFID